MSTHLRTVLLLALIVSLLAACKKKEPFQYPDEVLVKPPQLNTYVHLTIKDEENWKSDAETDGCDPNIADINLAFTELSYDPSFATIHLVPDTTACKLEASLQSDFTSGQVTNWTWDSLVFEFTYNEFKGNFGTSFWITLNYGQLELNLNIAPFINDLVPHEITDGLFHFQLRDHKPVCSINGIEFDAEFDSGNGNTLNLNGEGKINFIRAALASQDVNEQSYLQFQFIRISRYGYPDA